MPIWANIHISQSMSKLEACRSQCSHHWQHPLERRSPQQESGVVSWTGGAALPSLSVDRGQSILSPVSPPHQLHHLAPASQG